MEEKRIQAIRIFTHDLISRTVKALGVSDDIAFLLLDHFDWDDKELISKWETEKDEILKAIHVNVGSETVPSVDTSLHLEDAGTGTCPICNRPKRLVRLYCGHQGCKDCIGDHIRNLIKKHTVPVCWVEGCDSEIIAPDVDTILPHSGTAKNYRFWRLNKSFDKCPFLVGQCENPNCDQLIFGKANCHCHTVRCPKCEFATCLKCLQPAHSPLCCCKRSVDFATNTQEEFNKLQQDQDAWFKRESRYIEYRFQNMKDLKEEFELSYRALSNKQQAEQEEVAQQLKNIDLFVIQINTQIAELEEKLNEAIAKKQPAEQIEELNKEISSLNAEIEHYHDFQKEVEKENEVRKQIRKKELDFVKSQDQILIKAVLDRAKYDTYMEQYKKNLNEYALEKSKELTNEDDYIRERTVRCSACGLRFFKTSGCNEITCPCGHEFCTICGEPWITHKDGFYECPLLHDTKVIDYNDGSDYKYYPLPLDVNKKAQFNFYKRFHEQFLAEKKVYDELYQKFLFGKDKPLKKKEKLTDDHLCPLNKIVKRLQTDNQEDPNGTAVKIVNNVLFAQSVAMWGYGAIYYRQLSEFTNEYVEKLQALRKKNDELVALLNDPLKSTSQDINQKLDELKEEVDSVLKTKF